MKRKYVVLIAGSIIQICFGIFYIWSIFQIPVMNLYDWTNGQASTVFYIMLEVSVAGIIAGVKITVAAPNDPTVTPTASPLFSGHHF